MSKDNFIKNSFILCVSNSTMGVLRFIFSIILSKKLGAEGMGLYSLVMPIFDIFCSLVCGGLIAAISKESAVFFEKKQYNNLHNLVKAVTNFDFIWALLIGLFIFLLSPFLCTHVIKDSRAIYSLQVISPALIFIGLSSILKGYFYGIAKVTLPAVIDIVEKAIRIIIVVFSVSFVPSNNIKDTVTIVYAALSIGELISFVLLYLSYKYYKHKYYRTSEIPERRSQLLFNVLIVSVPLCLNGFLSTAIGAASTLIIPLRLISAGFTHGEALSMVGKFTGMALNISLFPIMIVTSLNIVLIPDISQSLSKKDYFSLQSRIENVLRFSFLVGISTFVICSVIPDYLGQLFFNRTDIMNYIKFSAIAAPFVFVSTTTFSILSGLGKQTAILKISILTSIEELILLYILTSIPSINIYSFAISLTISCITSIVLNLIEIRKLCYIHIIPSVITIDALIFVLNYLTLRLLRYYSPLSNTNSNAIIILILGFSLYFLSTYFLNKKPT